MKVLAIVNCRVSTAEQMLSNSLNRQQESVEKAAAKLGAEVPADGIWTGSVSSKAGTNVSRRDLLAMLDYCKLHKNVKYAIFDEYDRYMRSVNEGPYFEVLFQQHGVKVWYASESDTFNGDDAMARFMRTMSAYRAEGSNEERQHKSIFGHEKAVREGRYTFHPMPGYKKGEIPGVHVPHPTHFEPLQKAFKEVANRLYTPSEALKRLNISDFTSNRTAMKMDKFLHFLKEPYYAGIIVLDKQAKARCENGQHKKMITKAEHEAIIAVLSGRKTRPYSRKQFNPDFPMSKYLIHDCEPNSVFTGANQSNRKGGKLYPKYRCRNCGKQYKRDSVHAAITHTLGKFDYSGAQQKHFIDALTTVWQQKQQDNLKQVEIAQKRLEKLLRAKSGLVRLLANSDESLRPDIEIEIKDIKAKVDEAENDIHSNHHLQEDMIGFVKFALEYTNALKEDWWQLEEESRLQCKQLLFPAGITFDSTEKVSTTQISPLYRLVATKKNLNFTRDSLLVELRGIAPRSES